MTITLSVTNSGPLKAKVSGGTLPAPQELAAGISGTYVVTGDSPLKIEEVPLDSGNLAGGHGEDG